MEAEVITEVTPTTITMVVVTRTTTVMVVGTTCTSNSNKRAIIIITIVMEAVMATKTTKEIITAKVITVYGTDTIQVGGISHIVCD